uniref:HAT C-terminal dimerisation domain-containing protein n=1 Tax=Ditylenchus dipsaci TaxID=166011 RepID=A0A915D739_9BILA
MQETQFVDHSEDIERRTKVKFDPAVHSVQELKSKKFKFQFEQLLMEGKPAPMVVCKVEECRAILNWNGTSMRYHAKLHGSTANGAGEMFDDSLLKFIACSSQSINVVVDKSFLQLLKAFKNTVIEDFKNGIGKQAEDYLPSANTMVKRLNSSLVDAAQQIGCLVKNLKSAGGGLTMDFAKNKVDYMAVTAHFINDQWKKIDFVLVFTLLPPGMKKTSAHVQELFMEELAKFGISEVDMAKLLVTTDEGSNVSGIGGYNHLPCICHLGSTIGKRTTTLFKNSALSEEHKVACRTIEEELKKLEKVVNQLRQNEVICKMASQALKSPVQTRWMSYYNMVEALLKHRNQLLAAKNYIKVLKPVADMVLDLQGEKLPSTNKVIGHVATIWLELKYLMEPFDGNSLFGVALANAAMEAFERNIGNLNDSNWVNSFSGRVNKKVIACSAFLDPFEHGQLKSIGELVPGINYNEIEKMVKREARFLCSDVLESPPAKRSAKFPLIQVSQVEKELHGYMSLPICEDEDLLTFWSNNEKYFPHLAALARNFLAVQASSASSKRAFKELRSIMGDFTRNRLDSKKVAALIHLRILYLKEIS